MGEEHPSGGILRVPASQTERGRTGRTASGVSAGRGREPGRSMAELIMLPQRKGCLLKAFKRIWSLFTTLIVVLVVVVAVALVTLRLTGGQVFTILSGSMEPTFHVGSLIFVRPAEPQNIKVGDPISFVMSEDLVVATHRVVAVDRDEDGAYLFTTQGDANNSPDGTPVHQNNVIGVAFFTIPKLGYFVSYIREPPGMYAAIAGGALLILLLFLPEMIRTFAEPEDKSEDAEKSKKSRAGPGKKGGQPPGRHAR